MYPAMLMGIIEGTKVLEDSRNNPKRKVTTMMGLEIGTVEVIKMFKCPECDDKFDEDDIADHMKDCLMSDFEAAIQEAIDNASE